MVARGQDIMLIKAIIQEWQWGGGAVMIGSSKFYFCLSAKTTDSVTPAPSFSLPLVFAFRSFPDVLYAEIRDTPLSLVIAKFPCHL